MIIKQVNKFSSLVASCNKSVRVVRLQDKQGVNKPCLRFACPADADEQEIYEVPCPKDDS